MNSKISKNNKTGVTGVELTKYGTFASRIMVNYKGVHLGTYKDIESAIAARKAGEKKYFGNYAHKEETNG